MGCGSVNKPNNRLDINPFSGLYVYRIKAVIGKNIKEFTHEDQFDEMPLTTLMNLMAFTDKDSEQIDANFISVYDKENDSFKYYIQRLFGVELNIEDKTEWVISVNKAKFSWDTVCKQQLKIRPQDNLVWLYQKFDESGNND